MRLSPLASWAVLLGVIALSALLTYRLARWLLGEER